MEVGKAVTYVDASGQIQDALLVKEYDGLANIVVVNTDGADDPLGKNRSNLVGIPIRKTCPCVTELDKYKPPKEPKPPKEA